MDTYLMLKKKRNIRRIVETALAVLSLTALIVFSVLKEKGKVVSAVGVTPFFSYDTVEYTDDYDVGLMVSSLIFAFSFSALIADFACARIRYIKIDGEDVIIYNAIGSHRLLVNGEERDCTLGKAYLETKVKSGVSVVAAPQFFQSFHVTFSDGREPIDL